MFTNYAFMKILEKTQKQKTNKKDVAKVVQNKDSVGRMTVCNVPHRTPKLLINKQANKVVAKQKATKRLTPQGLDDEPQLLKPHDQIKLPTESINFYDNLNTEEIEAK